MNNKTFFLFSFLPAFAYWGLEAYYPPKIALLGGILLAVVELGLEKIFTKHVHRFSLLNFFLILLLGGVGVIADDGIWFKFQPSLGSLVMVGLLFFYKTKKRSLMYEMISDLKQKTPLPEDFYHQFEGHLMFFFLFHSLFMGVVTIYSETSTWVFWKTGGFYLLMFLFMVFEVIWFRMLGIKRRK